MSSAVQESPKATEAVQRPKGKGKLPLGIDDRYYGHQLTMSQADRELDRLACLLNGVLDTLAAFDEREKDLPHRDLQAVDRSLVAVAGAIEDLRETLKAPNKALMNLAFPKEPDATADNDNDDNDGDAVDAAQAPIEGVCEYAIRTAGVLRTIDDMVTGMRAADDRQANTLSQIVAILDLAQQDAARVEPHFEKLEVNMRRVWRTTHDSRLELLKLLDQLKGVQASLSDAAARNTTTKPMQTITSADASLEAIIGQFEQIVGGAE